MAEFEHNSEQFGYINLEDIEGAQNALTKLGYDPGTVDGKDGPKTQHAVKEFQTAATIKVDGIMGPQTRQAIMDALALAVEAAVADAAAAAETPAS